MTETITFEQVGTLLALAAARDQRTTGDADTLAWHADLNTAGITYNTASAALSRFYVDQAALPTDQRYRATTPDIIAIARKIRAERLANFVYDPPPGDEDPHYLDRLRRQITATADGTRNPEPPRTPIDARPRPVAALLSGIGRNVPATDDETATVRRPGPLGVDCPSCRAAIGHACRTPNRKDRPPHGARRRSAGGDIRQPRAERAETTEMERRRAAAAAALAALPPDAVIEPADGFTPPTRYTKES